MQTTLYFVRHGHVYNPQQIIYARLPRFRLSDEGVQQAILAAAVLKDVHPAAIYTSPMLRARQTAGYIAREHPGLRLRISRLINENFTPYQGTSYAEIEKLNGDIFKGVQPPYEQPADMLRRSLRFIAKMRRQYPGQAVIAVTHGDVVRVIVRWAMGLPPEKDANDIPFPGTGSVSALTFEEGSQSLPELRVLTG